MQGNCLLLLSVHDCLAPAPVTVVLVLRLILINLEHVGTLSYIVNADYYLIINLSCFCDV